MGVAICAAIYNVGVGLAIGAAIETILRLVGTLFEQHKVEKNDDLQVTPCRTFRCETALPPGLPPGQAGGLCQGILNW